MTVTPPNTRPVLRILHQMARSGGTIISRCLGSMDSVILLSEIHPFGTQVHNPLEQACDWFRLFTEEEKLEFKSHNVTFMDAIELIRKRVDENGKSLVIRDWSHLDYTGVPFLENPPYTSTLVRVLGEHYDLIQFSTVRHPVDQWISLNKLDMLKRVPRFSVEKYIYGYLRFAEYARETGYLKYEDFTHDSDSGLRSLCQGLNITFDAGYKDKWHQYETITGDNTTPSESRLAGHTVIQPLKRQPIAPGILEEFSGVSDFQAALKLLDYKPDI